MERVLGIGGVFFRARDPEALGRWYQTHLGVTFDGYVWLQQDGPTVFRPFDADTGYFPAQNSFMVNFRVADLDRMLDQLRAADIDIQQNSDWDTPGIGRFARIHDPEGNPIELWEPAAT